MNRIIWILALTLLAGACSSDSTDGPTDTVSPQVTTSGAATDGTSPATTAPATTNVPTTTSTPPAVTTPFDGLTALSADATRFGVTVDGTTRPRLSWDAVAGAARYSLAILDESGGALWAWGGTDSSIVVGGGEIDRDGPGARVATSAWAQVVAYDETGSVLAVSEPVSVGPAG